MLKPLIKRVLRRAWRIGQPLPTLHCPERIHGLDRIFSLHSSALIAVKPQSEQCKSGVFLGADVYVGKDCEIAAVGPGSIIVGEDTSFQDRCQIYGDVEIGAHCIFARNVLVISTEHKTMYRPNWLIRDQDEQFQRDMAGTAVLAGRKIRIEDDCWIGWGSTIMPGVYIGRGAVIGANCVVTRDVAPYETHGGAPNRKLGERLPFSPPARLDALDETCRPYFYRGFRHKQADLKRSLAEGVIEAGHDAAIVLAATQNGTIRLCGTNPSQVPIVLTPSRNGTPGAPITLAPGFFDVTLPAPATGAPQGDVPAVLRDFTWLELQTAPGNPPFYGLSSAELQN
jgi:acetyltransferase-like isoleucine patch superfamily enzyme